MKNKISKFHDKHYKKLLLVPIILIIFSLSYIYYFYSVNGDFFHKDISLTGGTSITIYDSHLNENKLKQDLISKLDDLNTRNIYDLVTGAQKAVIIETKTNGDEAKKILEDYLGYNLTSENSSFEFTGSSLGQSFYKQLLVAIIFAFLLMALVVFLLFRTFVPSIAVITSAFADILMTLTTIDLLGMRVSSAGIVAFLMLVGYSVDTDILLTNRVLRRHKGSVNKRIFSAFKTGITMTLTSLLAVVAALFVARTFSQVLYQIFFILSLGLSFDILNTWITNVSILKWYLEKKK